MCRTLCGLTLVAMLAGLAKPWDIVITAGDRLEFYTINGTKTDTVRFDSQNLTAIAYNEANNMVLYVDKQSGNDALCGYQIYSMEYKCYIERNGRNIQGLAFDPITEMLFFTDSKERSINWISLEPGIENNVNRNLLIKMADGIPTDIAVDSCRGYIYWINRNLTTSTIERARFNGSEREVVINASNNWDLHGLAVDQQTQKIYWFQHLTSSERYIYSADLSGKNKEKLNFGFNQSDTTFTHTNKLTISKEFLFVMSWCTICSPRHIWKYPKEQTIDVHPFFKVESLVGMVAKYTISDQLRGVQDCKAPTSLLPSDYRTKNSLKIARKYVDPFCNHGIKVNGQSLCKCTPGYTGERCDILVCENYCLQGDCSFNEEGLPSCRCHDGYTGDRCELNACHGYCFNNGTCSLNAGSEPVCQCKGDYAGARCEVSDCLNYCLQGNCSYNEEGLPSCRCHDGYTGDRCEVNACHGYCLNNSTCSLNEEDKPVCQCIDDYTGARCDILACLNNRDCSLNTEGSRCKTDNNSTLSNTSRYSTAGRNLTLADLFANWRNPVTKIVILEVNSD